MLALDVWWGSSASASAQDTEGSAQKTRKNQSENDKAPPAYDERILLRLKNTALAAVPLHWLARWRRGVGIIRRKFAKNFEIFEKFHFFLRSRARRHARRQVHSDFLRIFHVLSVFPRPYS